MKATKAMKNMKAQTGTEAQETPRKKNKGKCNFTPPKSVKAKSKNSTQGDEGKKATEGEKASESDRGKGSMRVVCLDHNYFGESQCSYCTGKLAWHGYLSPLSHAFRQSRYWCKRMQLLDVDSIYKGFV